MAIPDVDPKVLQNIIDSLYLKLITELTNNGFEIVDLDEIWNSELYLKKRDKRWWRKTYSGIFNGDYWGNMVAKPSGFEYIQPQSKTGIFTNIVLGKTPYKLNVTTLNVALYVNVFEDSESTFSKLLDDMSGASTVEIGTNFRINDASHISFNGTIRFQPEDLNIIGVIEDQEFEASQLAQTDYWGSDYGSLRIYSAKNLEENNANMAECDPRLYENGSRFGLNLFLDKSLEKINSYLK